MFQERYRETFVKNYEKVGFEKAVRKSGPNINTLVFVCSIALNAAICISFKIGLISPISASFHKEIIL